MLFFQKKHLPLLSAEQNSQQRTEITAKIIVYHLAILVFFNNVC